MRMKEIKNMCVLAYGLQFFLEILSCIESEEEIILDGPLEECGL